APAPLLSSGPPTRAMLPSADSATETPCAADPTASLATNLSPCCLHTPPLRVNTHAAPTPPELHPPGMSHVPPTMAGAPSADSATVVPCLAFPVASGANSLACWLHPPPLRVKTHTAPA